MRESTFTAAVRRLLPPTVYSLKLNLRFQRGVADSWYDGNKADLWVEWKYLPTLPPTIAPAKLLSTQQQAWLRKRHRNGRTVAVIIGCGNVGVVFQGETWDTPISREQFLERAISKRGLADWITAQVHSDDTDKPVHHQARTTATRH